MKFFGALFSGCLLFTLFFAMLFCLYGVLRGEREGHVRRFFIVTVAGGVLIFAGFLTYGLLYQILSGMHIFHDQYVILATNFALFYGSFHLVSRMASHNLDANPAYNLAGLAAGLALTAIPYYRDNLFLY